MDGDLTIALFFGGKMAAASALFFWLHFRFEGPDQARAKYKTSSLSLAYGWAFGVFAIGVVALGAMP